jgi:hypothetical protein
MRRGFYLPFVEKSFVSSFYVNSGQSSINLFFNKKLKPGFVKININLTLEYLTKHQES